MVVVHTFVFLVIWKQLLHWTLGAVVVVVVVLDVNVKLAIA
jgi:hypothetical protein